MKKPGKEKLSLLIPENIGDRVLSVCKTQIPTEYREKGIRCFKNYLFNISILSIFLIDCQSYTFLLMNIIMFRGGPLLRNSTLITWHLTVL